MVKFIIKRIAGGAIILLVAFTVTFIFSRVIPSDPAQKWVGAHATKEQIKAAEIELGLDKPIFEQYTVFLKNMIKGDLGVSIVSHRPVAFELKEAIPNTIELVIISVFIAFLIGVPIGVYSANNANTVFDHTGRLFSVGILSMPAFVVAILLQLLLSSKLGWLPIAGQMDTMTKILHPVQNVTGLVMLDSVITGNWVAFKDIAVHSILPVLTLMAYPLGLTARMTRSILLEVLNEDYISAARAFGIKERIIIWEYAVKNVVGTVVTVLALSTGYTLVNTFVIESIFSWPGVGTYIGTSVINLDYPAIIGVTLFAAVAYVLLNMTADIIIALDPRIRLIGGNE